MLVTPKVPWAYVTEKKAYEGEGRGCCGYLRTP